MEIARNEKVKQSKNGKFPFNYKASPIDFETQISLQKQAPQKGPLKNISPGAYFRNFTVLSHHLSKRNFILNLALFCVSLQRLHKFFLNLIK